MHAVNAWADLEQARAAGLVRFIGITGHARPELFAHALSDDERQRLIDEVQPIVERDAQHASEEAGRSPLFWLHDTKVMGWEKKDEPEMVWY